MAIVVDKTTGETGSRMYDDYDNTIVLSLYPSTGKGEAGRGPRVEWAGEKSERANIYLLKRNVIEELMELRRTWKYILYITNTGPGRLYTYAQQINLLFDIL